MANNDLITIEADQRLPESAPPLVPVSTEPVSSKPRRTTRVSRRVTLWCWAFLAPQLVMFLGFVLWPTIASWYFSLFDWDGIGWPTQFVGLDNFRSVATDPMFWHAFEHSLIYAGALIVIVVPTTLGLALVLNSPKLRWTAFHRTLFVLPVVLTTSVVGVEMTALFATQGGLINVVLMKIGVINDPINWLGSSHIAMVTLIIVGAWKSAGVKIVYWLAGLQTLPAELYDAAKVDRAGPWRAFRYVTLPLLRPFLVLIVFLQLVDGLHVFDIAKSLTDGGPYFATDVVPLYIYRYAFDASTLAGGSGLPRMGFASAAGIFYGLATFVIAGTFAIFARRIRKEGLVR